MVDIYIGVEVLCFNYVKKYLSWNSFFVCLSGGSFDYSSLNSGQNVGCPMKQ